MHQNKKRNFDFDLFQPSFFLALPRFLDAGYGMHRIHLLMMRCWELKWFMVLVTTTFSIATGYVLQCNRYIIMLAV